MAKKKVVKKKAESSGAVSVQEQLNRMLRKAEETRKARAAEHDMKEKLGSNPIQGGTGKPKLAEITAEQILQRKKIGFDRSHMSDAEMEADMLKAREKFDEMDVQSGETTEEAERRRRKRRQGY